MALNKCVISKFIHLNVPSYYCRYQIQIIKAEKKAINLPRLRQAMKLFSATDFLSDECDQ
jgi:hypothetical protein